MTNEQANSLRNSRLLDMLLDLNNSTQIPPDRRFDLSVDPPSDEDALILDIDRPSTPPRGALPARSYQKLMREVPHLTFASAAEKFPELLADLEAGRDAPADPSQGQPHPPSFLTADDIDNYIWEIDTRLAGEEYNNTGVMPPMLPTLAPLAHTNETGARDQGPSASNRDFTLRNPTSVYNWLRKHAPKTFLQDGEHPEKENGDEPAATGRGHGRAKGERGTGSTRGTGSVRGKRASHRDKSSAAADSEYPDEDMGYDASTPSAVGGKGKRKRVVDDDPGYRPKGGSSRPTKKKRKSDGVESTPSATTKRSRKSGAAESAAKAGDD